MTSPKNPSSAKPKAPGSLSKRGLFGLLGAMFLGFPIVVFIVLTQRDDEQATASTSALAQVPTEAATPMEVLDDPGSDGWPTEVFGANAKDQLKQLGKLILNPSKRNKTALGQILAEDVSFGALSGGSLETVFSDSVLTVERVTATSTAPPLRGIEEFESAVAGIWNRLEGAVDPRFEVKVFRVREDGDFFTTRQYVAISGLTDEGALEQHATWSTRWKIGQGDEPPLLASLEVSEFEQVVSKTEGRTLFSDCTEAVLGANSSYGAQIGRGFGHWLHRIQDMQYFFWLGIPGVALGDVNGDGLDDLYLCQEDGLPNRLYVQKPDGTLEDQSETAGVNWLEGSRSALFVDLDNDGDQDLAVAVMGGIVLAANRGDGTFEYRSLLPTSHDLMSMSAVDYDEDGKLDLYGCVYWRNASAGPESRSSGVVTGRFVYHDSNVGGANSLFRNESDGPDAWSFRDATAEVGLDAKNERWSLAAAWEDYDNDGDQDLYLANDFGRNCLYRNDDGKFVDVAGETAAEDSASGMAVTWADYNRDGQMDVYVSNMFSAAGNRITFQEQFKPDADEEVRARLQRFARGSTLLRKREDGSFADESEAAGVAMARWAWGTRFTDLNNDGWEDLVVANGNVTGDDPGDL